MVEAVVLVVYLVSRHLFLVPMWRTAPIAVNIVFCYSFILYLHLSCILCFVLMFRLLCLLFYLVSLFCFLVPILI